MAVPSYERRSYSEIAVATTLASGINDTDLSCTLAASTGWPTGASGDFYARIESEDIRVDTRSSNTLTFLSGGRGANGTTAATHASGVAVTLVFALIDADEANYTVSKTVAKATATGQILVADAANSFAAVQTKTAGQILVGTGTSLASVAVSGDATLASSGALTIANGAVTAAKVASGVFPGTVSFAKSGTLTTGVGVIRWRAPVALTLQHVRLAANTAPTGAAVLVDVNKNGTTVFSTQGNRPTVAIAAFAETATTAPDVTAVAAGDYLTVDIDQVGSTVAGANLTITIYYLI